MLIVFLIICLILIVYFKHKSVNHFTTTSSQLTRDQCVANDSCEEGEHCCLFDGEVRLDPEKDLIPTTPAAAPTPGGGA